MAPSILWNISRCLAFTRRVSWVSYITYSKTNKGYLLNLYRRLALWTADCTKSRDSQVVLSGPLAVIGTAGLSIINPNIRGNLTLIVQVAPRNGLTALPVHCITHALSMCRTPYRRIQDVTMEGVQRAVIQEFLKRGRRQGVWGTKVPISWS